MRITYCALIACVCLSVPVSAQVLVVNPRSLTASGVQGSSIPSQTVAITNGGGKALKWSVLAPNVPWFAVSPKNGRQRGTLTVSFSSGVVGAFDGTFQISSNAGTVTVAVTLGVTASPTPVPPPPPLSNAPTLTSYSPTVMASVNPVTVTVQGTNLVSGLTTNFGTPTAVTSTQFALTALFDSAGGKTLQVTNPDGQVSNLLTIQVAEAPTPPPPPTAGVCGQSDGTSACGPQASITCPVGAVAVAAGANIQTAVDGNPAGTTFCLGAGTHSRTSAITPKTGDIFYGAFGAILDGTSWSTADNTQAAFRAHNQDIDNVTIKNLVIRNMPQKGVHAFRDFSSGWIIDHCEIYNNIDGVSLGPGFTVQYSYLHNNSSGNYVFNFAYGQGPGGLVQNNEISAGGTEQKSIDAYSIIFRNNYVHNNTGAGIWVDGDAPNSVIEGNTVDDNGAQGIMWEQARLGVIRNNIIRRSGDQAIFVSTSKQTEIYGNTVENNFRGIVLFITCTAVNSQPWNPDLANVNVHDNTIWVPSGGLANFLSYSSCTPTQLAAYTNGSKFLFFQNNQYTVPSLTGQYWLWGDTLKTWAQWQALPQDASGTQR